MANAEDVYKNHFEESGPAAESTGIDGVRTSAPQLESSFDRRAFAAKLEFAFAYGEALFGLGSQKKDMATFEASQELYQHNLRAVVPYFCSDLGIRGSDRLLLPHDLPRNHPSVRIYGQYIVDELDYYFIAGDDLNQVSRGYHTLTGRAPMPPKWFFGYAQSKERYVNAQELVDTVCEFRRRGIPLDLIVLDWKLWPDSGLGQKSFDPVRFPAPKELTAALHGLGAKLMVSVWPTMTGEGENRKNCWNAGLCSAINPLTMLFRT